MKRDYIKKLRHLQVIIFISLLSIYSLCGYLLLCNKELSNRQVSLTETVQTMLKEDIHDILNVIKVDLNEAINNGEVSLSSDDEITDWVISHNSFNYNEKIKGISLINIGYSTNNFNNIEEVLSDSNLSIEVKEEIYDEFKNINCNDTKTLINQIEQKSIELSEKYNVSSDIIRNIILESTFTSNKVLFSTNTYDIDNTNMSYVINDDETDTIIWVESISIPDGNMGFNDEPMILNDQPNYNYKKLILSVTVDATKIMEPYKEKSQVIATISNIISYTIIIIIIITTVLVFSTVMILISKLNKRL